MDVVSFEPIFNLCNVCMLSYQNVIYLQVLNLYLIYGKQKVFKKLLNGNLESICWIKCIELYVIWPSDENYTIL